MAAAPQPLRFRDEFRDFWRFVRKPTLGPRLPHAPMPALAQDWVGSLSLGRILRWVGLLWVFGLALAGPLAYVAASSAGATHRLDPTAIPFMLAIVSAPIVEELMFRFWLRRPGTLLWLMPAFVLIVMFGSNLWTASLMAVLLALTAWPWLPWLPWVRWRFKARRRYVRHFPWIMHLATLAFAFMHLMNYAGLKGVAWWVLPVLVLPQWITGLVLAWIRVRRGIGAAILMHACFNAGPVLLVWGLLKITSGVELPQP